MVLEMWLLIRFDIKNHAKKEPTWRWGRVTVPWKTTQGQLDEVTTSISSSPWYVDALLEELAKSLRRRV